MALPISEEQAQTLTDHLTELRFRLVRSAYGIVAGAIIMWNFADKLLEAIAKPIAPYLPNGKLVFLNPTDMFVAHMKLAGLSGLVLSSPIWLYQLWKFVSPGLYAHEKKYSLAFIFSSILLFLLGSSFCFFFVLPAGLKFLLEFGASAGQAMITLPEYLSFFVTMIVVFGAAFELPMLIVVLGLFGIVDQKFLREKRRYAIVIMAVAAAIVTPPDVLSMMMLLVPLWLLYEASILVVGITGRRKTRSDVDGI
ncbi:MAG: twin-arginine translocase subunit TatC [Proteobacteria bacterium]|nr:MAG: twin-arginine translocase subunit TatC [Pseudomonadota bacterium]